MSSSAHPYPPLLLADRVLSLERAEDPVETYERQGAETKAALVDLVPAGFSWRGKRVLDFGCGAGRTLRHFLPEAEDGTDCWGVDIDGASVAWIDANLSPPLRARAIGPAPPLPFEDRSFDLIWAISVFTHLTDQSLPWLAELHRVLKPDGLLMASYMGSQNSGSFDPDPWDEDQIGMNVLLHDNPWDTGGPAVLISDWWMREHWGRAFEVLDVRPMHGQSWPLLRKRPGSFTALDLAIPADDPRELAALRRNVRQLQHEVERVRRETSERYEKTSLWRAASPLRPAYRAVKRRIERSRS